MTAVAKSEEQNYELIRVMWTDKKLIREIMQETGLSSSGISAIAKRLGLPPRHTRWPAEDIELVSDGTNRLIDDLAQRTGRTPVSIANHVADAAMRRKKD